MSSNLLWTIAIALSAYLVARAFKRILVRIGRVKNVPEKRLFYLEKTVVVLLVLTSLIALIFVWSVDIKGISVIASSVFAVIGVALFAQWSILSNITASVIIFFTFPARVGDVVRIVDGDNSVEGTIKEITLFQVELEDVEGNRVIYPNNLLLQKPVIKLKKDSLKQDLPEVSSI